MKNFSFLIPNSSDKLSRVMKKIITLVLVFSAAFLACGFSGSTSRKVLARALYGKIFVTDRQRDADYVVYITKSVTLADLFVYETSGARFEGCWEFVKRRRDADFTICYSKSDSCVDLCVCFVDSIGLAGPSPRCR